MDDSFVTMATGTVGSWTGHTHECAANSSTEQQLPVMEHLRGIKWDEWMNAIIICNNRCPRKFFIGYRDATSNRQGKVVENFECNLTDFNALINSHSSFETSVLKVLYTSRQ